MYKTRLENDIIAEFLPPKRKGRKTRVIILCDGFPSIPRKQPLAEFLAAKGFWVIYPRYRGAWESGGEFLAVEPQLDVFEIIDLLPHGLTDIAFREHFPLKPDEVFVIGGSFGGATALMCSLDSRVKKVVANCPVVDWGILPEEQTKETSNKNYAAYIREAFGNAYRLSDTNWNKVMKGNFFNPAKHLKEFNAEKVIMFHAKDDPYIPWKGVSDFAKKTGIHLKLSARGGHLDTVTTVQKNWATIAQFFKS